MTHAVIGAAVRVHRALGPGLLESAYEVCLTYELARRGFHVRRQVDVPITYAGLVVPRAYRIDLVVDAAVAVEVKAVERLLPVHKAQVLSYVRLAGLRCGLLLNFHEYRLTDGVYRLNPGTK